MCSWSSQEKVPELSCPPGEGPRCSKYLVFQGGRRVTLVDIINRFTSSIYIWTRQYLCTTFVLFSSVFVSTNKFIQRLALFHWRSGSRYTGNLSGYNLGDVQALMVRAQVHLLHPQSCRPSQPSSSRMSPPPADSLPVTSCSSDQCFPCQVRSHTRPSYDGRKDAEQESTLF